MSLKPEEVSSRLENARERAKEHLEGLEILKEWIEDRLLRDGERRAFIVEFAGMPKAGKSGVIETIRHYFTSGSKAKCKVWSSGDRRARPYRVHTPAEGVSLRTPGLLKESLLDYNSWAGAYALQELLQAGHDNYHDLVILDRGPWDAGCWLQYVRKDKSLDSATRGDIDKIIKFFQLGQWMTRADLHIVLTVDPDDAAQRERDKRLIDHSGPASNKELMAAMREIYNKSFSDLQQAKADDCTHVGDASALLIDTTGRECLDIAADVLDRIFKVLSMKLEYNSKVTKEDVLRVVQPLLKDARPEELKVVDAYIPEFLDAASQFRPDASRSLRKRLHEMDISNEESEDLKFAAARYEGQVIVQRLKNLLNAQTRGIRS